ncbi:MAG: hypothetical protein ACOYLN_16570 [Blastocatellia bacterium]|jgi:hypothetical protein
MPRQNQIVAVVIKHYGTGLYRTCVSLAKDNMVSLGTYGDERSASDKIGEFWKAYDEGQIKHPDDLSRLIGEPSTATHFSPTSGLSSTSGHIPEAMPLDGQGEPRATPVAT